MAISQFPPQSGGSSAGADFVVNMNNTSNNVAILDSELSAGGYDVSFSSGSEVDFDIYFISASGQSVGYTNNNSIVASDTFDTVVAIGVSSSEIITFTFTGAIADATATGTEVGAGAYLTSASPTDLSSIDDTTNISGGNFASDVEIYFESGETSTIAKNVVRSDSNSLIVTRPDSLSPDLDPWTLRVVNPGVPEPTGSNAHILVDVIDAGALPVWVTTSPLPAAVVDEAYSTTLEATDADGSISYALTAGSLPTGLSLNSATGVISGTATVLGSETFTITATDEGGNTNTREFDLAVQESLIAGADVITKSGGFVYAQINSSKTITFGADMTVDVLQIGGGGSGATSEGGGGGAGGYQELSAISVTSGQSESIIIGGAGGDTSTGLETTNHSIGGGNAGNSGGSGGGALGSVKNNGNYNTGPHSGGGAVNSSFGNSGGNTSIPAFEGATGGGGGGGSANGGQSVIVNTSGDYSEVGGNGGNGLTWFDGITRAGGGGGAGRGFGVPNSFGFGGSGGGGNGGDGVVGPNAGAINTGSGGGAISNVTGPRSGGSGVVVIRYSEV